VASAATTGIPLKKGGKIKGFRINVIFNGSEYPNKAPKDKVILVSLPGVWYHTGSSSLYQGRGRR
jgi:hypothetical protein